MRAWVRAWFVGLVILVVGSRGMRAAHAQESTVAEQLFREGKRLLALGKTAEACKAFEGSYRKEPLVTTLLNLADCRERNSQYASAWSHFLDAERLAKAKPETAAFVATAHGRAERLESKLSYLIINVPKDAHVDGLQLTRNGAAVDEAEWNTDIPVDGGEYVVEGREPWPATVAAPELTLADPSGALNASMGVSVRCGDVTADHRDDMVVGAPTGDDTGTVYVFGDIAGLPNAHLVALTSGDPTAGLLGQTVAVTDFDGDGIADVFAGAPNLPAGHAGRVLGWLGRSVWPSSIASPDITIDNPSGVADERFGRSLD